MAEVAVVIPAYRAAATIGKAVQSCLDDSAVADIVVVMDGPDPALEAAIPKADRVRVIVNPSTFGAPAARNIGMRAVNAEFILFLDADDYVEDGLIGALARQGVRSQADIMFGSYAFELPSGRRIPVNVGETIGRPDEISVLKAWFAGNYVPCCSVLWRLSFITAFGGWNEALLKNQDGELVWRAIRNKPVMACASAGRGIYVQGDATGRVSGALSPRSFDQQLDFLAQVESESPPDELGSYAVEIASMYYRLARLAYYNGHGSIGATAEQSARRLGFLGHNGSILHRVFAALFGLGLKERLCARLHRVEQTMAALRPRAGLLPGMDR